METYPVGIAWSWLTSSIRLNNWMQEQITTSIVYGVAIFSWIAITLVGVADGNTFLFFAGAGYAIMILSAYAVAFGIIVRKERFDDNLEFMGLFLSGLIIASFFVPQLFRLTAIVGAISMLVFAAMWLREANLNRSKGEQSEAILCTIFGVAFLTGAIGVVLTLLGFA